MKTVAILLTVHSRREKTLACLANCFLQADSLRGEGEYGFGVYLVDDGSSDGTSEAVREMYPDVRLLKGDGTLYWNQGMRLAWSEAAKDSPDFYLWINDDTLMREGALASIMETSKFLRHRAIVVGTCQGEGTSLSYGGRDRRGRIVPPDNDIPVPCYTFNGNLVLVPSFVYGVLGNLEPRYHHTFGDYDYGVRAVKKRLARVVCPGVVADCPRNPGVPGWRDPSIPVGERFRILQSPKGRPFKEQFLYDMRDRDILWAIGHRLSLYFKTLFPSLGFQGIE